MPKIRKVVLLINPSRTHTRGLLTGIAKYARIEGLWAFYRPLEYRESKAARKLLSVLAAIKPDGILMREPPEIEEIIKTGIPIVCFPYTRERFAGVANVITNHILVGEMAAKHLLDRGLKRYAYCGFDDWWWSRLRGEGFRRTVAKAGLETFFYKLPRTKSKRSWDKEPPIIADWLRKLPKPIGLMTCNDDRGELVIEACKIGGVQVPDEVVIVGVDNDQLICDLSSPPLSSVELGVENAGYEAAALLDKIMGGESPIDREIYIQPVRVVTRKSTDVLCIDDADMVKAVRFIRQHAQIPIRVDYVADAVHLSRRVLEKRFRSALGHSIHDEIRRVRIEQIVRMLTETQMSISEIAHSLGFPDVAHISRYFRREKGMSPLKYRKDYLHR
jgi:LacI family transcriptional regulator